MGLPTGVQRVILVEAVAEPPSLGPAVARQVLFVSNNRATSLYSVCHASGTKMGYLSFGFSAPRSVVAGEPEQKQGPGGPHAQPPVQAEQSVL